MQRSVIDPKLDFSTASSRWLDWHRPHIGQRTAWDYEQYILALERFDLGPTPLNEIHPGHFEQYQVWRRTNPKRGAKNPRINQELNCLKQILEQAGLWEALRPFYKPLKMPKWKDPRAMSSEQEDEVLRIAAREPGWIVAHCVLTITNNTAIGPGEERSIQIEHLRLASNYVLVSAGDGEDGHKNEFRQAPMALNIPAQEAFWILYMRYRDICSKQGIKEDPKHFLIPYREKKGWYDPTRQASPSFIRSALREIRAEAGLPKLRHYDFRHQIITTLLQVPQLSVQEVQGIARHKIGDRTIERYSHSLLENKQQTLNILHDSRRFDRMKRLPQRQDAESTQAVAAGGFARNPSYPQR